MFASWYGIALVAFFCIVVNLPFGWWRGGLRKFSPQWFLAVHAPVPMVVVLRLLLEVPSVFIPLFIVASIAGQYLGGKIRTLRIENTATKSGPLM